ncbi:(+)-neomenthol dehydrogenase [Spatholobus suberectus]|nr:(+)-neomenthol dehydrogenase [Spatholobus suberectus]
MLLSQEQIRELDLQYASSWLLMGSLWCSQPEMRREDLEAVKKLQKLGLPCHVLFHQLDVTDPASLRSLADFIKNQYGKLDILARKFFWLLLFVILSSTSVNNAGIPGAHVDGEALAAAGIVVNNAGIPGAHWDGEALAAAFVVV